MGGIKKAERHSFAELSWENFFKPKDFELEINTEAQKSKPKCIKNISKKFIDNMFNLSK